MYLMRGNGKSSVYDLKNIYDAVKLSYFTPKPTVQGNTMVVGRKSQFSLYDNKISSFEDDGGAYDQKDAAGFIKLQVCVCVCV